MIISLSRPPQLIKNHMKKVDGLLYSFDSIGLTELDEISFSDRMDTKSVFSVDLLPELIGSLVDSYRILELKGSRTFRYESVYLDTPDLKFYHDHQRNKARRHKIRFRKYLDNGSSFLEIKSKNGKGRSSKTRIPTVAINEGLSESVKSIITALAKTDPDLLAPTLQVSVTRVTLLKKDSSEKVTLDYNVTFSLDGKVRELNNLVIAEVKQLRYSADSDFFKAQRKLGIYPTSISKYCVGVASLADNVKTNRFKASLMRINKIIN